MRVGLRGKSKATGGLANPQENCDLTIVNKANGIAVGKWIETCREFAARLEGLLACDPTLLRDLLAELDSIVRSAPLDMRKRYARFKEEELSSAGELHSEAWNEEGPRWPTSPFEPEHALRDAAILARSLDLSLRDADTGRHVARRDPSTAWRTSNGEAFVIPLHRPEPIDAAALERSGYDKRGILHHRVIPATVEGLAVRLVLPRSLSSDPNRKRPLVGGVGAFPGMEADFDLNEDGFLITGVRVEDLPGKLAEQCTSTSGCDFFLWPELSVDDDALRTIRTQLAEGALRIPGAGVVIAGSWHREDEGGTLRNLAPVLSGAGRTVDHFAKIAIYGDKDVGFERVTEGSELLVLVGDGHLATVCICKDFSDLQDRNPWTSLPVDVVLVVSMGEDSTMEGHLVRAQELRKGHGRLTFIVQQGIWNAHEKPQNYLLPGPDKVPSSCKDTMFPEAHAIVEMGSADNGNLHGG